MLSPRPMDPPSGWAARTWLWMAMAGVWLMYLLYPIGEFLGRREAAGAAALAAALLALFLAAYVGAWRNPFHMTDAGRLGWAGVLVALSLIAAWLLHLPDALGGIVYAGPVLGFTADRRWAAAGIAGGGIAIVGAWRLLEGPLASASLVWNLLVPFVAVAVAMQAWSRFWRLGVRLRTAERQLAELAVANERLALARDLHDVVGHTLSALAMRADLAAREASGLAPASAAEMRRVAQLARDALADVRRLVSSWRAVTLAGEWGQARGLLEAAGLKVEEHLAPLVLPPEVDRGLAFFVREGVTNILRHSAATECRLTLAVAGEMLCVALHDNGQALAGDTRSDGSGLAGLRERFLELGGRVSGDWTPSGFRLGAEVPWHGV